MKKTTSWKHRNMRKIDLEQVLEIEELNFPQPYSREILEQELKIPAATLWVVNYHQKIIAYINFWTVADEIELVSIAVHPQYVRRGIASYLMKQMIRYGKQKSVQSIVLDVRLSNEKAQKLYLDFGFAKVGLRKKYYSDNQEDAIIMKRVL